MGRFHPHADGTMHVHDHDHEHEQEPEGVSPRDVGDHSGYVTTGTARVEILEDILSENDRVADANQKDFADAGVRVVNIMSSPGAGKTTLLSGRSRRSERTPGSASWRATSPPASMPISWRATAPPCRWSTPAPVSAANATSTR